MIKQLVLGGLSSIILASATPLLAVPTPPTNWTGFYAGVNAGGATGHSSLKTSITNDDYFAVSSAASVQSSADHNVSPSGFIGGGQIGYNYQAGHGVYGIEGDFDALNLSASSSNSALYPDYAPAGYTINESVKTNWLATVRPKLGWAQKNTLLYVTGGFAFTDIKVGGSFSDDYVIGDGGLAAHTVYSGEATESASTTKQKSGYALGFGGSYALQNNWSLSAEYIYVDFGRVTTSGILTWPPEPATTSQLNHSADLSANIFRLALNYKF